MELMVADGSALLHQFTVISYKVLSHLVSNHKIHFSQVASEAIKCNQDSDWKYCPKLKACNKVNLEGFFSSCKL